MGMANMYTINQGRESIFMKRVLLLLGMALSVVSATAEDNVLQNIEIEPVKDTYNIVLTTDKAVDVKKTVQGSNKITLNLKDIRASKTLNTDYNNVDNVDTVMVEPQGNGLSIFFQAENAADSTITFDTPVAVATTIKPAQQSIKLSNPIESYAPIYKEDYTNSKTSNLFKRLVKNSTKSADLRDSIDEEEAATESSNKLVSFGLLTLLIVAVSRLFKRKEPEMKIGLSQSLNDNRNLDMYSGFQPLPAAMNTERPFTTVNYGINAYRNENRNPYETAPMHLHNPRLRDYVSQQVPQETVTQTVSRPMPSQATTVTQTVPKKMTTPVNTAPVNQSNPNAGNIKFLESMTEIYEKSGRHDLARGLKTSLSKNFQ